MLCNYYFAPFILDFSSAYPGENDGYRERVRSLLDHTNVKQRQPFFFSHFSFQECTVPCFVFFSPSSLPLPYGYNFLISVIVILVYTCNQAYYIYLLIFISIELKEPSMSPHSYSLLPHFSILPLRLLARLHKYMHKLPRIHECIIQRRRRHTNHIRLPLIHHNPII